MTILGLALDLLLIGLLGTMIFFVVSLRKRLDTLRNGKQDLEVLLRDLVKNTATAERNLRDLQSAAEELAPNLQKQVTGARAAREELEFLLSSADAAADRLLAQIGAAKAEIKPDYSQPRGEVTRPVVRPAASVQPSVTEMPKLRLTPTLQANGNSADTPSEDARRTAEADLLRAIEKLR